MRKSRKTPPLWVIRKNAEALAQSVIYLADNLPDDASPKEIQHRRLQIQSRMWQLGLAHLEPERPGAAERVVNKIAEQTAKARVQQEKAHRAQTTEHDPKDDEPGE